MTTKTRKAPAKPRKKTHAGQFTKAEAAAALGVPKAVLSIPEFCAMHGISTGLYFKMKKDKKGPAEMHTGSRVTISLEAAAGWRKAREVQQPEAAS